MTADHRKMITNRRNDLQAFGENVLPAQAIVESRDDRMLIELLHPHLTYLENNPHLMRYARLRDVGLPIWSGVTEGACKSLIQKRTNSSGQRW